MNKLLLALMICFTLLISACGGGGGDGFNGGGSNVEPVNPTDPIVPGPDPVTSISVGNGIGLNFVEGDIGIAQPNLDASGKTSLQLTIVDQNGDLVTSSVTGDVTVTFSSNCIANNQAVLEPAFPVLTSTGVAVVEYTAAGCAGTDTITAIVAANSVNAFATGVVSIVAPTVSTIQYVAQDTIPVIGLAGSGLTEQAPLQFKVLDTGGNPVPNQLVNFQLLGSTGDTSLTSQSDLSGIDGIIITTVVAGTVHDSVRVKATIDSTTISSQSNQLWIGTGLPHQNAFSISTCENIEGGQYDGETQEIKVILSDRFGNPVPSGTAVTFTAEGGQVEGGCNTEYAVNVNTGSGFSFCEVNYTSADPRPDGTESTLGPGSETRPNRANVIAYSTGEESYVDQNGSGTFDDGDADQWTNLGEVYADLNENDQYDLGEVYVDANNNGSYDLNNDALEGSPKFNGVLCEDSNDCSTDSSTKIGAQVTMIHSASFVGAWSSPQLVDIPGRGLTLDLNNFSGLNVTIPDTNGNPMPVDTSVQISVSNGSVFGSNSSDYPCSTEPVSFGFFIEADAEPQTKEWGLAQIEVETPKDNVSTITFWVYDGPPLP